MRCYGTKPTDYALSIATVVAIYMPKLQIARRRVPAAISEKSAWQGTWHEQLFTLTSLKKQRNRPSAPAAN